MLGLKGGGHGTLQKIWFDIQQIDQINYKALGGALAVLVVIVGARKISKRIPGALLAVVGAIAASWALDFGNSMHVLGTVPSGLPHFALPQVDWSLDLVRRLAPIAFAMFVVILAQSAATSRACAAKYNESFDQNADLNAMGLANIGVGLSGTFVVAGSPTKTQMVDNAGGRTQPRRSLSTLLKERGIRLVVAQVLEDVGPASRYELVELFGKNAFYDTLDEVAEAYQEGMGKDAG